MTGAVILLFFWALLATVGCYALWKAWEKADDLLRFIATADSDKELRDTRDYIRSKLGY